MTNNSISMPIFWFWNTVLKLLILRMLFLLLKVGNKLLKWYHKTYSTTLIRGVVKNVISHSSWWTATCPFWMATKPLTKSDNSSTWKDCRNLLFVLLRAIRNNRILRKHITVGWTRFFQNLSTSNYFKNSANHSSTCDYQNTTPTKKIKFIIKVILRIH